MRPRAAAAPLFGACLALALAAAPASGATEAAFVTVRSATIRAAPQFYAPAVASAGFRERLSVLARERGWVRVRFRTLEGWVHRSATAARAATVTAKEASAGVSPDDVALASKGFDATIESEYRKGQTRADYAEVDRVEALTVSEKSLAEFRQAGRLRQRGEER